MLFFNKHSHLYVCKKPFHTSSFLCYFNHQETWKFFLGVLKEGWLKLLALLHQTFTI